jgi:xylulokinase
MLLMDVEHKCWSEEMLDICGIDKSVMPGLYESYECIGTIRPEISKMLGLSEDVKVAAGAGDNAAAAVGTGTVGDGDCNISLGTSGTIFISSDKFVVDHNNALHSFAHADGKYHLMGCMLSAASCNKWLCDEVLKTQDYAAEQTDITDDKMGRNHVFFLPYLMGERSPINDTDARGTFTGLRLDTKREDIVQAVLEGVAFAIKDNLEIAKEQGINVDCSTLCGGGAKSPLWQKIFANVLNLPINIPQTEQGPGYGGAMLAMVGSNEFNDIKECASKFIKIKDTIYPDTDIANRYDEQYKKFKKIYPSMKNLFKEIK